MRCDAILVRGTVRGAMIASGGRAFGEGPYGPMIVRGTRLSGGGHCGAMIESKGHTHFLCVVSDAMIVGGKAPVSSASAMIVKGSRGRRDLSANLGYV